MNFYTNDDFRWLKTRHWFLFFFYNLKRLHYEMAKFLSTIFLKQKNYTFIIVILSNITIFFKFLFKKLNKSICVIFKICFQPGLPKFVGDIEKCNFTIEWKTSAACSLNMSKQHTDKPTTSPDTGNCTIRNPVNKDIYDLRYLRQENNIIVYSKNRKTRYSLTACGSVPSFCGETSGMIFRNPLPQKFNFTLLKFFRRLWLGK